MNTKLAGTFQYNYFDEMPNVPTDKDKVFALSKVHIYKCHHVYLSVSVGNTMLVFKIIINKQHKIHVQQFISMMKFHSFTSLHNCYVISYVCW